MALFTSLIKSASDNFSRSSSVTVLPLLKVGLLENLEPAAIAPAAIAPVPAAPAARVPVETAFFPG